MPCMLFPKKDLCSTALDDRLNLFMKDLLYPLSSLLISIVVGLIYIPKIVIISKRKNLYDESGGRKPHKGNIPRIAGMAFFPAFIVAFFVPFAAATIFSSDYHILLHSEYILQIGMLMTGLSLLYMMGFVDDLISVSWRRKFLIQFFAALMPVLAGMGIDTMDGLFLLDGVGPWAGAAITVFVVMLLINAYNLIDGIDGLCSSLSIFATAVLGAWFLTHGYLVYGLVSTSIAGITAVYFYYNTTHGQFRTFMGDTGSTNLGYIIAFLSLAFYNAVTDSEASTVYGTGISHPLSILLGIVALPLFDTARVFAVRISKGLSPFHPDKRHLHHKLLDLGLTHLQCTLICFALQGCYFGLNYVMRNVDVNIVLLADLGFMVAYVGAIDLLVRRKEKLTSGVNFTE